MTQKILGLCVTCDQVYSVVSARAQEVDEPTSFCSALCEVVAEREFKHPACETSVLLPGHLS